MALGDVLARIPGYGGFQAKRQMNMDEERASLQEAVTLAALQQKMAEAQDTAKKRAREQEFRGAIDALPADASEEDQIRVASRFVGPEKLLTIRQASADRARQREIMVQAANDRRDQQNQLIELRYQTLAQTAANEEQKRALEVQRLAEIERNNKRHDETLRLLGELKGKQSAQPKAPPGFRYKSDGSDELEAIPGGPKDTSKKDAAKAKGAIDKASTVIAAVDEALGQTGPLTTGLPGQVLGMIPGTSAYDLDGTLDTIKANLGFTELQAMRDASPTGGALGQVAIQELAMLQSTLASLKRGLGRQKLEAGLKKVRLHMENWRKAVQEANAGATAPAAAPETTSGAPAIQGAPAAASPTAAPTQPQPLSPAEQAELEALRKKHGRR